MPDDLPKEYRRDQRILKDKMDEESQANSSRSKNLRKASRYADQLKNPCLKESERSMKCMDDTGYDRDQCTLYFKNYRNCMDFWSRVKKDRRQKGIDPHLPLPEDREHIRQEYMKLFRQ